MGRGIDDAGSGATDSSIAATLSAVHADAVGSGVWKPDSVELTRGAEVGRHVVLSRLDTGGVGVVYAAYDPEPGRKVVLKLLRDEGSREVGDGKARLLREAQALARLNHPNVVAVHDVGAFGERVYLAMEHVEGQTLRAWLQAERPWPEVLGALLGAGRGLAAAHAAGLVHRDVKPDNIMVGADGRARVMDFGLARPTNGRASTSSESLTLAGGDRLGVAVTRTGATIGTPAYMAPEQWAGKEADARSDQFAFCVTLWEALYGQRPFAGDTLAMLAPRVLKGECEAPPRGSAVPSWLRAVLLRGLQAEPERRFPGMPSLLAALERGQTRARRIWLGVAIAGLTFVGIGVGLSRQHARVLRARACVVAGAEIGGVWSAEVRAGLKQALLTTGVGHAETTFAKATPWIDRWAARWSRVRTQVCHEATVDATRTAGELALATACLDERRDELAGLLAVLGDGERAVGMVQAVPAVAGLSAPETCADAGVLARRPAPPADAEARARALALRRDLMRVRGLQTAGRAAEAVEKAAVLLADAEQLAYRPLEIEARLTFGRLAFEAGDPRRAEEALVRAHFDAGSIGADEPARAAATALVDGVGVAAARPAEGLVWARMAAMLVARLGQTGTLADADVDAATAAVHLRRGAPDEAQRLFERALALREKGLGPEHPTVAATLRGLAAARRARGDLEAAQRLLERALAIDEEALGADSPVVAGALGDLAAVLHDARAYDQALPLLERALPIAEKALGPEHPEVGELLGDLAATLLERGEATRATALFERALKIQEAALGVDHPAVARAVHELAVLRAGQGDHAAALGLHRRALAARERALGPDHADVLRSLDDLGEAERRRGELAEAAALAEQALALRERTLGPHHPDVAGSLERLAEIRLSLGTAESAAPLLARALEVRRAAQGDDHRDVATTQTLLGELALARGRRQAAVPLFTRALTIVGVGFEAEAEAADAATLLIRADARFGLARALGGQRGAAMARAAADDYRAAGPAGAAKLQRALGLADPVKRGAGGH